MPEPIDEIETIMATAHAETFGGNNPSGPDFSMARFLRYRLEQAGFVIVPAAPLEAGKGE